MEKTEPGFKFIWTSTDRVEQCVKIWQWMYVAMKYI